MASATAVALDLGLDTVSVETLKIIENTLHDEGKYSRILEELCLFLIKLHREAVTNPLSQSERAHHLQQVNAKLAQIRDRIGMYC